MIETLLVALIVLTAVGFMGRRVWRAASAMRRRSDGGCNDGCGGCH